MPETRLKRAWINDSFVVPALTIRIPMPRGAAVPADDQRSIVTHISASADNSSPPRPENDVQD